MEEIRSFVIINLDQIVEGLRLRIDTKFDNTLSVFTDAVEHGEAEHQLYEGFTYDYELNCQHYSLEENQIIQPHSRRKYLGTISPNIFVGTLSLPVLKDEKEIGKALVEVRSAKSDYREDYRDMLELITEKCTDLLMKADSPVTQNFETDFDKNYETLYQKFSFVKSIIATEEFAESVHRIVSSPVTQWQETTERKDIRNIRRFRNSNIKELVKGTNRIHMLENHYLRKYDIHSLPEKINKSRKTETVDTPENRFVKFALENFLAFCSDINKKATKESRLWYESGLIEKELESWLQHSVFKEISRPETLRLNSPVLQRKEGYREVLRVWLMFDLAAKLVWKGGDDVYSGGKKDIATLYEYWLFFKLLELLKTIFKIEPKDLSDLIKETPDGLNLQLKQGYHTALRGVYDAGTRWLNIRFNYNRSFSGRRNYPDSGSWSKAMRPDYTLSFWPEGISEKEAERQELIVHIHFDAKYKVNNLRDLLNEAVNQDEKTELGIIKKFSLKDYSWEYIYDLLIDKGFTKVKNKDSLILLSYFWEDESLESIGEITGNNYNELIDIIQQAILSEEKEENKKGVYKNADILKMHAYKDAIRRTGGAYVLYPGDTPVKKKGFHEIIPGLGAFPVRPSKEDDGISDLKKFILEVIDHFVNRTTQREKTAYRVYDIHKTPPKPENELREALPETYGENRSLIPDETHVLVGYYRKENLDWIIKSCLYNARAESDRGSLRLGPGESGAKYLLLHTSGETKTGRLYKIIETGPRVFSKQTLISKGYPSEPSQNYYLVYKIQEVTDKELINQEWDITKLEKYKKGRGSALPFSVTLAELMKTKLK